MKTPEETLKAFRNGDVSLTSPEGMNPREYIKEAHYHLINVMQGLEMLDAMNRASVARLQKGYHETGGKMPTPPREFEKQHTQNPTPPPPRIKNCFGEIVNQKEIDDWNKNA